MPEPSTMICAVCRNEIQGEVPAELVFHVDGQVFPTCCGPCAHELAVDPSDFTSHGSFRNPAGEIAS